MSFALAFKFFCMFFPSRLDSFFVFFFRKFFKLASGSVRIGACHRSNESGGIDLPDLLLVDVIQSIDRLGFDSGFVGRRKSA